MDRYVRSALATVVAAVALTGCASTPETPRVAAELSPLPVREAPPEGVVEAWFAARAESCAPVVETVALYAAQPGVVAPKSAQTHGAGGWCAVVPVGQRGQRADSWAQNVSAHLKTAAIAFYVADGRWSYTVFDQGLPVAAMESHSGEPLLVGDIGRAAGLLGQSKETVNGTAAAAKKAADHRTFATQIGIVRPDAGASQTALVGQEKPEAPKQVAVGEALKTRFDAGTWVVMPPLGVLLIKTLETREIAGAPQEVYVVVDGAQTLPVPVASAGQMGMRALATVKEADEALERAASSPAVDDVETYAAERSRGFLESLKRGELQAIAESYAALCVIGGERSLYSIEAALKDSLQEWLIEELSTAKSVPREEIGAALVEGCN